MKQIVIELIGTEGVNEDTKYSVYDAGMLHRRLDEILSQHPEIIGYSIVVATK